MNWARPHYMQHDQSVSAYMSQSAIITLNWRCALPSHNVIQGRSPGKRLNVNIHIAWHVWSENCVMCDGKLKGIWHWWWCLRIKKMDGSASRIWATPLHTKSTERFKDFHRMWPHIFYTSLSPCVRLLNILVNLMSDKSQTLKNVYGCNICTFLFQVWILYWVKLVRWHCYK